MGGDGHASRCASEFIVFDHEIKQLERVLAALSDVECTYEDTAANLAPSPDRDIVQEAFHCATHEAATVIGFALHDIRTLIKRIEIRNNYSSFTTEEFQFIVGNSWSTKMVSELMAMLGDNHAFTLSTLSQVVKEIQHEWNSLRRLNSNYGFPTA